MPWLSSLLGNKQRFQRALALLQEYSLIDISATGHKLHNCVHDWTLQALNRDINEEYFWVAVHCIASNVRVDSQNHYWKMNRALVEFTPPSSSVGPGR